MEVFAEKRFELLPGHAHADTLAGVIQFFRILAGRLDLFRSCRQLCDQSGEVGKSTRRNDNCIPPPAHFFGDPAETASVILLHAKEEGLALDLQFPLRDRLFGNPRL